MFTAANAVAVTEETASVATRVNVIKNFRLDLINNNSFCIIAEVSLSAYLRIIDEKPFEITSLIFVEMIITPNP